MWLVINCLQNVKTSIALRLCKIGKNRAGRCNYLFWECKNGCGLEKLSVILKNYLSWKKCRKKDKYCAEKRKPIVIKVKNN